MVLCVNKSVATDFVKNEHFQPDIMTEWYHHMNKARVWPYAIFSYSRSIHSHLLIHIFLAQYDYLRNHIQQIVGTNKKEPIKRVMFFCLYACGHTTTHLPPPFVQFYSFLVQYNPHKYMRCILSPLMSTSQFIFLLIFGFLLELFFFGFLPLVSCFV